MAKGAGGDGARLWLMRVQCGGRDLGFRQREAGSRRYCREVAGGKGRCGSAVCCSNVAAAVVSVGQKHALPGPSAANGGGAMTELAPLRAGAACPAFTALRPDLSAHPQTPPPTFEHSVIDAIVH
jgi:hypothetical protein